MKARFSLVVAAGLITIATASCATFRVHTDYDPDAGFGDYRTFAWMDEHGRVSSGYVSPLNVQRIERAIESELTAKGFEQRGEAEEADFLVSFTVGTREEVDVNRYPVTYRGRWVGHWPYQIEAVDVHSYTQGMLAIDIHDREHGRPVWHGLAGKRVTGADIEDSGPVIREAVAAVLASFPPL